MEHNPTQTLSLSIVPNELPDLKIVKLTGPMTIHNFFEFQEITRQRPLPRILIVDLTEVPYIDSAALGSFVGLHVSCEGGGKKYALIGANDRLKSLFEMTHVKSFLVTYESLAEAQAQLDA